MTPRFPGEDELRGLIDALCDETIAPAQFARLEELLLAHPEAEAYYVQSMSLHADLIRTFTGAPDRAERVVQGRAEPTTSASPHKISRRGHHRSRFLLWSAIGLSGLAAGLLLGIGFWPPTPNPQATRGDTVTAPEAVDNTVAVLLQTHKAEWEDTGMPTRPGAPLPPGSLVLKAGHAHIEFYNGATVILEGPAEFQLLSRTRAFCTRGKLRATVPPQAEGFTVGTPATEVIDRGTEFGMEVGGKTTDVHVFQGKVDVYPPAGGPLARPDKELTTGQGARVGGPGPTTALTPNPAAFLTAGELTDRAVEETTRRRREWVAASDAVRRDPALLAYYPFQPAEPAHTRTLRDEAGARQQPRDGAIVGCSWGAGRWTGKPGLDFKRTSDRVLLHIPGEFESLTLAAWVRPDALPNQNNALLMADGWEEGELHWQIGADGTLILGVKSPPHLEAGPLLRGSQYRAHRVVTPDRFGRWVHLAVVYDRANEQVTHYVDGRPVASEAIQVDTPLRLGDAQIGNWNAGMYRNKTPIRNFNGCIDELTVLTRPLSEDEVGRLFAQGQPPS